MRANQILGRIKSLIGKCTTNISTPVFLFSPGIFGYSRDLLVFGSVEIVFLCFRSVIITPVTQRIEGGEASNVLVANSALLLIYAGVGSENSR